MEFLFFLQEEQTATIKIIFHIFLFFSHIFYMGEV